MLTRGNSRSTRPRVAIVHDALVNRGGAERVVTYMCEAFPDAPVFTSVYLPDCTYEEFRHREVHVLPGARWVRDERRAKRFLPLWIAGFRALDLKGFDAVLSSSTFGAKHVRPPAGVRHAGYLYAPFRLVWKPEAYDPSSVPVGRVGRWAVAVARPLLRAADRRATARIPALATTCRNMAEEIARCYGRDARIIPAPVRLSEYRVGAGSGEYYLTVSRLISHKRVDLAIEACKQLRKRLIVVGDGPQREHLQRLGDEEHVRFVGAIPRQQLVDLYAGCRALLFCGHEDYGLAPIEAQASGRPVIAYGAGGVLETVIDGWTGVFFKEQTVEALVDAMRAFEQRRFDAGEIRRSVERFDVPGFVSAIREFALGPSAMTAGMPTDACA
jgi:glycosyltransferase involved in cell wall biosynthesis